MSSGPITRRGFVHGSLKDGPRPATDESADLTLSLYGKDFTEGSSTLTPNKTIATTCQFCNSNCRMNVGIKVGRVVEIRGEHSDPVQNGNLCVKHR